MLHCQQYLPASIRSLINNLDAALTACESLHKLPASEPHSLLRLELTAIAHVLQAREHMRELQSADGTVTNHIVLFLTVTDCLESTTPATDRTANLEAAGNCLIGGYIPIATLIALLTAMRDVLELCFAACDEDADAQASLPAPVSEAQVWATGPDTG